MLSQTARCGTAVRPGCARRSSVLVVRASGGNGSSGAFQTGMKVKVTSAIKVYHAPKHQSGLDLNGMEGTVVKDVTQYKGKVLSANFPVEVEFVLAADAGVKPVKFKVHLGEDELQVL